MAQLKFTSNRYPSLGEICTLTDIETAKVAALLFDKIYVGTRIEDKKDTFVFDDIPEEITFGVQELDDQIINLTIQELPTLLKKFNFNDVSKSNTEQLGKDFLNKYSMNMTEIYKKHGIDVVPTFSSFDQFRANYPEGHFIAYQAALNNIPLVSQRSLSWKQVIDFREDKDATNKYRSLRLWLSDSLKAKSLSQATDIIGKRIDEYKWAIKKHGLKTITGAFSKIISLQSISAIVTGAGMAAIVGGPLWSAIVAGTITTAEVGIWLVERHVEKLSIGREDYSDIAILHEAKQILEKSKK